MRFSCLVCFFFCVLLLFFLQSTWVLRFLFLARVFFRLWFCCVSSNFFELAKPGHNHTIYGWHWLERDMESSSVEIDLFQRSLLTAMNAVDSDIQPWKKCINCDFRAEKNKDWQRISGKPVLPSSRENMLILHWKSFLNLSLCNRERVRIVAEKLPPSRTNGRSVARNVARMVSLVQSSTMTLTVPGLQSRRGRSCFFLGRTPEPIESSVTLWTGTKSIQWDAWAPLFFRGVSHWLVAKKCDHASKYSVVLMFEPHSYCYHIIQGPLALFW